MRNKSGEVRKDVKLKILFVWYDEISLAFLKSLFLLLGPKRKLKHVQFNEELELAFCTLVSLLLLPPTPFYKHAEHLFVVFASDVVQHSSSFMAFHSVETLELGITLHGINWAGVALNTFWVTVTTRLWGILDNMMPKYTMNDRKCLIYLLVKLQDWLIKNFTYWNA